jgi:hypothetical protein
MPTPNHMNETKQVGSEKASMAKEAIASRLDTVAEGIRQQAPAEGSIAQAAKTVADKLEYTGEYLRSVDLAEVGREMAQVVRRHPVPFIVAGLGIGFLATRALRRES